MSVPTIDLRPGYTISRILRGGWQLSGDHGTVEADRAADDVTAFFDAGITALDCADIYTGVESLYGEGLRRLANRRGAEAAASMKIHTKYVPDIASLATLSRDDTRATITRSLQRLGRDRLDLLQFHWWDYAVPGCLDAMGHLAELQAEGLIDRLGITNFGRPQMEAVAKVADLVSAQVQYSLLDRRAEGAFAEAAARHGIHILCYGVLAGGFLTDHWHGKPDPGFAFENRSLVKYRLVIEEFGGWDLFQTLLDALAAIGRARGADIAAVATRAMLDRPDVAGTIVGARYARHLSRLLKALDVSLTQADRSAIEAVQAAAPGPAGDVFALERDRDGPHGRIMKYNLNTGA